MSPTHLISRTKRAVGTAVALVAVGLVLVWLLKGAAWWSSFGRNGRTGGLRSFFMLARSASMFWLRSFCRNAGSVRARASSSSVTGA